MSVGKETVYTCSLRYFTLVSHIVHFFQGEAGLAALSDRCSSFMFFFSKQNYLAGEQIVARAAVKPESAVS